MSEAANYPKVAQLKDVAAFRARLAELNLSLPVDDRVLSAAEGSPLARPMTVAGVEVGNRWCIHPMEGWDANRDGSPSAAHAPAVAELWPQRGEAHLGRRGGGRPARWPGQPESNAGHRNRTAAGWPRCSTSCTDAHREAFGSLDGLLVGLQLTHSGRFCKPDDHHKMRAADRLPPSAAGRQIRHRPATTTRIVWTDDELEQLIDDYVAAARLAHEVGLPVRRREGLPRLPAARVSQCAAAARPVRRRSGRPLARAADDHRSHPRARFRT